MLRHLQPILLAGFILCTAVIGGVASAQSQTDPGVPDGQQAHSNFHWKEMAQLYESVGYDVSTAIQEDGSAFLFVSKNMEEDILVGFADCSDEDPAAQCQSLFFLTYFDGGLPGATLETANAFNLEGPLGTAFIDEEKDIVFVYEIYAPYGALKGNIVLNTRVYIDHSRILYARASTGKVDLTGSSAASPHTDRLRRLILPPLEGLRFEGSKTGGSKLYGDVKD